MVSCEGLLCVVKYNSYLSDHSKDFFPVCVYISSSVYVVCVCVWGGWWGVAGTGTGTGTGVFGVYVLFFFFFFFFFLTYFSF